MPNSRRTTASTHLRRSNSAASNVLRASKIEDCQRINPEIARQYAIAAANLAYKVPVEASGIQGANLNKAYEDRKMQSVRFTGPNAVLSGQRSITRRVAPSWDDVSNDSQIYSPGSLRPSLKTRNSFLTALPKMDTPANAPVSSYRKLRKSRSMFSPRKAPFGTFSNGTPRTDDRSRTRHSRLSGSTEIAPSNWTPGKSIPTAEEMLLQLPNPYQTTYDQDAAIELARQEYRRQVEFQNESEQHLKSKASSFSIGRRRNGVHFRKTVRTSSGNSFGPAIGSQPVESTEWGNSIGNKARKISVSLKDRLKKVFHRKSDKAFPVQQINSQRLHFSEYVPDVPAKPEESHDESPLIPLPDRELLSRASSRASLQTPVPLHRAKNARSSSLTSVSSLEFNLNESRVTSWANSTITSGTESKMLQNEKKRLTIIQENGAPYQPSCSSKIGCVTNNNSYATFRKPLRPGRINEPVDSQMMFSALRKRLDERAQAGDQEQPARNSGQPSQKTFSESSGSSRSRVSNSSQATKRTTVRMVSKSSSSSIPDRGSSIDRVPSILTGPYQTKPAYNETDDIFGPPTRPTSGYRKPNFQLNKRLSLAQIADLNESQNIKTKKPLRESRSAFFPLQRQTRSEDVSPYRKALRSSSDKIHTVQPLDDKDDQTGRSSIDSCSVYSRKLTGTPQVDRVTQSSDSVVEPGIAVIIDAEATAKRYSRLIGENSGSSRNTSGTNSGDWKRWMASQIESFEKSTDGNNPFRDPDDPFGLIANGHRNPAQSSSAINMAWNRGRPSGHRREHAQIMAEETDIAPEPQTISDATDMLEVQHNRHSSIGTSVASDPFHFPLSERDDIKPNVSLSQFHMQPAENRHPIRRGSDENSRYSSSQLFRSRHMPEQTSGLGSKTRIGSGLGFDGFNEKEDSQPKGVRVLSEKASMAASSSRRSPERIARLRRIRSTQSLKPKENLSSSGRYHHQPENQTINGSPRMRNLGGPCSSSGAGLLGTVVDDRQVAGSARMVELFLSSRNSRNGSRKTTPAFV